MITHHIIGKLCKRKHKTVLVFTFSAAALLLIVGRLFGHEKAIDYGALWLFEQCIGGAKRSFFGDA